MARSRVLAIASAVALGCALATPAAAHIYQVEDPNGVIYYTNNPHAPGARIVVRQLPRPHVSGDGHASRSASQGRISNQNPTPKESSGHPGRYDPGRRWLAVQDSAAFIQRIWFERTIFALARYASMLPKDKKLAPHKPKSHEEILRDWQIYASKRSEEGGVNAIDHKLARKVQGPVSSALSRLTLIGGEIPWFMYDDTNPPLRFVRHRGSCGLIIDRLGFPTTYNTLKLTARARATAVLQSVVLPALVDFEGVLKLRSINFIGFVVSYGSEDFAAKTFDPETMLVMCPTRRALGFVRLEVSQERLVESCESFLSDRESPTMVKKIDLELK